MKATIHYYDARGVGRWKEVELEDLFDVYKVVGAGNRFVHARIGKFAVAYDTEHLHVAEDYTTQDLGMPEDMRNDRVKVCRQAEAIVDYYTSTAFGVGECPAIYTELKRAIREELEMWRNR